MPTRRIFPVQNYPDYVTAIPQLIRFLVNDKTGWTGPAWRIIEAYDGTTREVPSLATDMDSFSAGFGWRTNSVGAGDWIVLQSLPANNSNVFQVYFEIETTSQMNLMMIPYADFATGGSAVSPPLFPTSSFGVSSGSFETLDGFVTDAQYTIVADEGMCAILTDQSGSNSANFTYLGELDSVYTSRSFDDRCYVVRNRTTDVGWTDSASSGDRWTRLSPLDNTTVLGTGYSSQFYAFGKNSRIHENTPIDNLLTASSILPVGIHFADSHHVHFAGWCRNLYASPAGQPEDSGTFNNSEFMFRRDQAAEANLAFPFDSSSSFGRDLTGSLTLPPTIYSASLGSGNFDFYCVEPDTGNNTVFAVTGSTIVFTGSFGGGTTIVEVNTSTVVTGAFDRNRLRITYPSIRRRPRPAQVISN